MFLAIFFAPLFTCYAGVGGHVQEMSVAAIAATAVSAGESFLPYMSTTCAMLGPLMTLQEEKMLNVRHVYTHVVHFDFQRISR